MTPLGGVPPCRPPRGERRNRNVSLGLSIGASLPASSALAGSTWHAWSETRLPNVGAPNEPSVHGIALSDDGHLLAVGRQPRYGAGMEPAEGTAPAVLRETRQARVGCEPRAGHAPRRCARRHRARVGASQRPGAGRDARPGNGTRGSRVRGPPDAGRQDICDQHVKGRGLSGTRRHFKPDGSRRVKRARLRRNRGGRLHLRERTRQGRLGRRRRRAGTGPRLAAAVPPYGTLGAQQKGGPTSSDPYVLPFDLPQASRR